MQKEIDDAHSHFVDQHHEPYRQSEHPLKSLMSKYINKSNYDDLVKAAKNEKINKKARQKTALKKLKERSL
jgi:hypothetical protein